MAGQIQPFESELAGITNVIGSKLHTNYYSTLRLFQSPSYRKREIGDNMELFLRKLNYAETQFLIEPQSTRVAHKIGTDLRDDGITVAELDNFSDTWDDLALKMKLQFPKWLRESQFMLLYGTWAIGESKRVRSTTWEELNDR